MTINITAFSGSAAIGSTEWSLTANMAGPVEETSDGIFQALIDFANLATGDIYIVRIYEEILNSAGAQRLVYTAEVSGDQAEDIAVTPPLFLGIGWDVTVQKISGTDRLIDWRIASSG